MVIGFCKGPTVPFDSIKPNPVSNRTFVNPHVLTHRYQPPKYVLQRQRKSENINRSVPLLESAPQVNGSIPSRYTSSIRVSLKATRVIPLTNQPTNGHR